MNKFDGLWLHTLQDGEICRQGHIIGDDGEYFLVQWYGWLGGEPTTVSVLQKAVAYSDECRLYTTDEDMRWAYERQANP